VYFAEELAAINLLMEKAASLEAELDEMREEESGDDGLLKDVLNEKGDSIPKANLNKRLKELEGKKTSSVMDTVTKLVALFEESKIAEMEALIREVPKLAEFDIRNKNGTFGKAKLKAALKAAVDSAVVPEIYKDEYDALTAYAAKSAEKDEADKAWKEARKALDEKVEAKYSELTVDEIKHLLFDMKWMAKLETDICDEIEQVLNSLSSRVLLIAKRYEHTLGEIEDRTAKSRAAVVAALERMGYKW
jgi:type I restriction enzyme M protein